MPLCPAASVARHCGPPGSGGRPSRPRSFLEAPGYARSAPGTVGGDALNGAPRALREHAPVLCASTATSARARATKKSALFFPGFDGLQASIAIHLTEDAGIGVPAA